MVDSEGQNQCLRRYVWEYGLTGFSQYVGNWRVDQIGAQQEVERHTLRRTRFDLTNGGTGIFEVPVCLP